MQIKKLTCFLLAVLFAASIMMVSAFATNEDDAANDNASKDEVAVITTEDVETSAPVANENNTVIVAEPTVAVNVEFDAPASAVRAALIVEKTDDGWKIVETQTFDDDKKEPVVVVIDSEGKAFADITLKKVEVEVKVDAKETVTTAVVTTAEETTQLEEATTIEEVVSIEETTVEETATTEETVEETTAAQTAAPAETEAASAEVQIVEKWEVVSEKYYNNKLLLIPVIVISFLIVAALTVLVNVIIIKTRKK